ncbi:MAG: decaprenyl-phosphate phosphoribosyltransferase [Crocinitomicaceae bacterium]|jgi:4-hydroxybenzoate polyprenyltransferase|nr:decaprenyl-phosphate phosphoribosyltransferase [Crocinitomicaceae bacterium]
MKMYFELLRIKSWVKNGFLFLPLVFALKLLDPDLFLSVVIAFFSFSFCSSFIYIINDVLDAQADALHPRKKNRPIPSGKISSQLALMIGVGCLAVSFGLVFSFAISVFFSYVLLCYLFLNIAYVLVLKNIHLIELFVVAINFVLRVLAGCFVINVAPSNWILVVTFFLSLLLVLVKRRAELVVLGTNAAAHRKVLKYYSEGFLDKLILIAATITITAYILYSIDPKVTFLLKTNSLIYTSVFVVIGVFRFVQLSEGKEFEGEGDPTTLLFKDRFTQLVLLAWLISLFLLLYVK